MTITDTSKDTLYIDFDEEYGWWGVFGDISGHCYATFCDKEEAQNYTPSELGLPGARA
jgi:hypothetical protein